MDCRKTLRSGAWLAGHQRPIKFRRPKQHSAGRLEEPNNPRPGGLLPAWQASVRRSALSRGFSAFRALGAGRKAAQHIAAPLAEKIGFGRNVNGICHIIMLYLVITFRHEFL